MLFDSANEIVGARIRTYLLERSRLVYQPETERNYHIFYQLLSGAPSKERKDLSLPTDPQQFAYLAGGGSSSSSIPGVDDVKEFRDTQEALSTVGISVEQQWSIFKVLAALLHLGNVNITQARTDAVLSDEDESLILATNLLGLPVTDFKKWTIKKQLATRTESVTTNLTAAQATVVRDSVAKFIYSCLFDVCLSFTTSADSSVARERHQRESCRRERSWGSEVEQVHWRAGYREPRSVPLFADTRSTDSSISRRTPLSNSALIGRTRSCSSR